MDFRQQKSNTNGLTVAKKVSDTKHCKNAFCRVKIIISN